MKNFQQWCIENEEYVLLKMYENGKNEERSEKIGYSSSKKVKWKCEKCNTEWKLSLNKATKRKNKECLYCTHKKASYFYNVITEVPELKIQWNYEKNGKLLPSDFTYGSSEKVWWKCKKGHIWQEKIKDRVREARRNLKNGRALCPFCNHERVSATYNLVTEFPNIAKQWNYIKNGSLTPLQVSPKSQKKVWWTCEYNPNHIWQDTISNRTALNRKCPICSKEFTISFPARVLFYYLKSCFNDCEMEYRILKKYTVDIYIPYYKIIIEYDGWYYHINRKEKEQEKDEILKSEFDLIRIKESKEEREEITYQNEIVHYYLQERHKNLDEMVKKVLFIIEQKTGIKINKDVNFKRDYQKIEDLYYHVRKSNSVAVKRPELLKEWSSNNEIAPDTITLGSKHNIKWICIKCGREYVTTINNRINHNCNCPYCSNRRVCEDNSLEKCSPQTAAQWNYEKNGELLPSNVTNGSDKKVWWKCEKGHEWEARVYARTGKHKSNCPICFKERTTKK